MTSAPLHSFTPNKDTYRDLKGDASFVYAEVAVGADAPVVAANSMRIGYTRTDGSGVVHDVLLVDTFRDFGVPQTLYP